ncbi:hypothetical protein [Pontibacter akesuensis]|uniref:Uncharacterized protein n=1 Tax=Pontibacter akesuensis TaxID=388950 RepID=A0A1I7FKY3_9BACT|nr:hypothetical protein [Pontibacter akesuensis]GHA61654.1 hypothetical protein GCM10007389_12700 [Pontibacter akesuensis]SFU36879.1 hypothetical protein SAMN04487941_0288 [Pontibacter akesuensis]
MNTSTITKLKEHSEKKQRPKGQKKKNKPAANPQKPGEADPQEEGLYAQVRQDEALRAYHTARLLETPGYGHLGEGGAGEMVEQMLRLSTLLYEMLLEERKEAIHER